MIRGENTSNRRTATMLPAVIAAIFAGCLTAPAQQPPASAPQAAKPQAPRPPAPKPAPPTPPGAAAPPPVASPTGPQPPLLGQFGDWGAYTAPPAGKKVCFALAKPASSHTVPPNRPRDQSFMFVSSRP